MMVRALWAAPVRNKLFLLSGALFIVIAVTPMDRYASIAEPALL